MEEVFNGSVVIKFCKNSEKIIIVQCCCYSKIRVLIYGSEAMNYSTIFIINLIERALVF